MKVTVKQVEANRRNAKKSTGLRATRGKAASRWNALKHGVLAREAGNWGQRKSTKQSQSVNPFKFNGLDFGFGGASGRVRRPAPTMRAGTGTGRYKTGGDPSTLLGTGSDPPLSVEVAHE